MRSSSTKHAKTLIYLSVLFIALLSTTCDPSKEYISPNSTSTIEQLGSINGDFINVCNSQTFTLLAGQTINAGTVKVSNDNSNLYVTYSATSPACFGTLHLWVGSADPTSINSTLPRTPNGVPIPGQFPYTYDTQSGSIYTFTIPLIDIFELNGICNSTVYVVAHAEMDMDCNSSTNDGQTAFGGNNSGTGPRWWYYANYPVICCENPLPPARKIGTAYAYGDYIWTTDPKSNPEGLPSLKLTKNRWGWAINIKNTGTSYHNLYVGAGLNNISKALLVGVVKIDYDGSQVTVTYNYNSGYSMEEVHIYAGDLSPTVIAPGQYGHNMYFSPFVSTYTTTFSVNDTNGDGIWIIAHAGAAYGL